MANVWAMVWIDVGAHICAPSPQSGDHDWARLRAPTDLFCGPKFISCSKHCRGGSRAAPTIFLFAFCRERL